jgi:hypothetical protein
MSTSVDTGLNSFHFIRKHFLQFCVRKVAVHLWKVLEVMSTSVGTDLNRTVPYRSLSTQRLSDRTVFTNIVEPKIKACRTQWYNWLL